MKKLSIILLFVLMLSLVGQTVTFSQVLPKVPRNETLIVDALHGRLANPKDFNF